MAGSASQNRGNEVLAVTVALFVASTFAVVLRFISRIGIVKRVSMDDYFMIVSWVSGYSSNESQVGTDTQVSRRSSHSVSHFQYATEHQKGWNPALMATKTSICLFYLTLAKNHRIFKWTTVATLVVVNVAGTALTLLNIFQCRPFDAGFHDPMPLHSHCIDIIALYLSSAPINIITDIALLFLPMPILTSMRLPRNEKLILIVTFSFGGFVAVVDVIRIAYLQKASGPAITNREDFPWIASLSFMWSAIEVDVGIMCACVPGIKPLAAKVFPNLLGRIKHARHTSGNSYYGPGDAQWAGVAPKKKSMVSPPRSPISEKTKGPSSPNGNIEAVDFLTTPDMQPDDVYRLETTQNEDQIGFADFLNDSGAPGVNKAETGDTADTKKARKGSLTVFDFVNVNNPKCMARMSNREAFPFLCLVTILFFLWGCAYGLLAILNSQFQNIIHSSEGQNLGLHAVYFGAYFVGPLTFGRPVFQRGGFKATFITGLCVYGTGTLVFWPSAVLASYPAFLVCNFIVGLGVSTLEVAGNPFIALCGPPEYAEIRLNVSQAVQAIGSVVSPILAKKVLFKDVRDAPSLNDIQWTYLGIALFDVVLALIFHYLPLPEASDEELQDLADERREINHHKIGRFSIIYVTLGFGILSNFCYVGGQEAVAGVFIDYVRRVKPNAAIEAFDYQSIGHTVFAIGRFLAALACVLVEPRWILGYLYICLVATSVLAMNLTGYAGVAMVILIMLFESGIFSIIFAMCIRGLGSRTKMGSILLTASTSGGAVIPVIMSPVNDARGIPYGFSVVVAVFSFGLLLPLWTIIVPAAKQQVNTVTIEREADLDSGHLSKPKQFRNAFGAAVQRKKRCSDAMWIGRGKTPEGAG
ncbi:MAG: hypothetical protein Q9167_007394 [Letrouitia subvulpina]